MGISKDVRRLLKQIPVPYKIVDTKDHTFLYVDGYDRMTIGSNSSKMRGDNLKWTRRQIKQIIEHVTSSR